MTDKTQTKERAFLSGKQERAMSAILGGASLTEAAELVSVGRPTVSHWVNHDPNFIAHYRSRQEDLWAATRHELVQAQRELLEAKRAGVRALQALAEEEGVSAGERLRAANALLSIAANAPSIEERLFHGDEIGSQEEDPDEAGCYAAGFTCSEPPVSGENYCKAHLCSTKEERAAKAELHEAYREVFKPAEEHRAPNPAPKSETAHEWKEEILKTGTEALIMAAREVVMNRDHEFRAQSAIDVLSEELKPYDGTSGEPIRDTPPSTPTEEILRGLYVREGYAALRGQLDGWLDEDEKGEPTVTNSADKSRETTGPDPAVVKATTDRTLKRCRELISGHREIASDVKELLLKAEFNGAFVDTNELRAAIRQAPIKRTYGSQTVPGVDYRAVVEAARALLIEVEEEVEDVKTKDLRRALKGTRIKACYPPIDLRELDALKRLALAADDFADVSELLIPNGMKNKFSRFRYAVDSLDTARLAVAQEEERKARAADAAKFCKFCKRDCTERHMEVRPTHIVRDRGFPVEAMQTAPTYTRCAPLCDEAKATGEEE